MIKKPAEMMNEVNKFRVLIAGYPGIGKTTLGLSAPKPLLIDVDFGINRVMASVRKDYIQPESYEQLLSDLKGDLSDYETIVIDTGGKLLDLMKAYVIKNDIKNAKKGKTKTKSIKSPYTMEYKSKLSWLPFVIYGVIIVLIIVIAYIVINLNNEEDDFVEGAIVETSK